MAQVSVVEAANRLGVGVPRVHQRIADGSLRAERIGSQWVIDELSLLRVAEDRRAGRPVSARSAWALIALAEGDADAVAALASSERSRAKVRLDQLLSLVAQPARSEQEVRRVASALRHMFCSRASLLSCKAAVADLPRLRQDARWQSVMSSQASGIASELIVGYLAADDVDSVSRAYLLLPAEAGANVVIYALPNGQKPYADSALRLAADLADQRGAREELRAAELLHDVALQKRSVQR